VDDLVDEIGDGDHRQREGAEKVMAARRKELWESVPNEQYSDVGKGDDAEDYREGAMGAVETAVHELIMDCGAKGSREGGGVAVSWGS
jgi:hypothetical protein